MTNLQQLIEAQVRASVVASVSRTTDKIADAMAREILKDRAFRARIEALIKQAFERTVGELQDEAP